MKSLISPNSGEAENFSYFFEMLKSDEHMNCISYDLLDGGSLIVIENIIDDNRRKNAFGLIMSLNMNIETPEGFEFSAADFDV